MAQFKFEDIAYNITTKRKPLPEDKYKYIGLEHMESGSLFISQWGLNVDIKGEKLIMQKGDILLGKRNAYLRRAAIAPHDGLFSAHGMILRPNLEIVDKDYFPFFIASDYFFDEAIRISVGGLSPTINWKDLAKVIFNLPPLNKQKDLAKKLWAAYRLKEGYKKLLKATDEMVKSQFIEMISDAPIKKLIEVVKHSGEYGSNTSATIFDGQIRYVRITDITSEGDLNDNIMSPVKIEDKYLLEKDDILFARTGNTVGKTYLHKNGKMLYAGYLIRYRLDESIMFPQFLFSYTHTSQYYNWIDKTKKVGAQPNISAAQYDSMPVPVPILSIQHQFNKIAEQADKSKLI